MLQVLKAKGSLRASSSCRKHNAYLVGMVYNCGSLLSELLGQEVSLEQTDIISCVFVRANLVCADLVETA